MIVYSSDLNLEGSGYVSIGTALCDRLAQNEKVVYLGLEYWRQELPYRFSAVPLPGLQHIQPMTEHMKPRAIIVGLDIPLQIKILESFKGSKIPYYGIFPVEAGPLTQSWTAQLWRMKHRFVISEFGKEVCAQAGLPTTFLPPAILIGNDPKTQWKFANVAERELIKDALKLKNKFTILTVADNQERKNLSAALRIVAELVKQGIDVQYFIVTRVGFMGGWILPDLIERYGLKKHVTLINRGTEHEQLWTLYAAADALLVTSKSEGACVIPGEKVWTPSGRQPIETLSVGESVITHTGKTRLITETFERNYSGNIITIKPSFGFESIKVTPEHPIFCAKHKHRPARISDYTFDDFKWIRAGDVEELDFVYFPTLQDEVDIASIQTTDYVDNTIPAAENEVSSIAKNQFGATYNHPRSKLKNKIVIDKDFMTILGFYIAEGCYSQAPTRSSGNLRFSFHEDEIDYHKSLISSLKSVFNIEAVGKNGDGHKYIIDVYSTLLGKLLKSLCGATSHLKHLPYWVMQLPKEKLLWLLEAMFYGDAYFSKTGHVVSYTTVSEDLAKQLQFILIRFGICASIHHNSSRGSYDIRVYPQSMHKLPFIENIRVASKSVSRAAILEEGIAVPVKSIETSWYEGKVHNLEVAEDHSYLLEGGAVHNCFPLLEAMAVGTPVVGTDCTAIHDHLKDGRGFPVPYDYQIVDAFGNGDRFFIDIPAAADALMQVRSMTEAEKDSMTRKAYYYVANTFNLENSVNILMKVVGNE